MADIDIEKLLGPVSAENPCGPDLRYDAAYLELEKLAQGTPEQQMGSSIVPAVEPNWKDVREKSVELLGRTKDFRVAVTMCRALLRESGVPGLRDGLGVLRGFLERFWDGYHPRLDPEDHNDPLERMNALAAVADPQTFVRMLREAHLSNSRQLGRFSLRDVQVARGEAPQSADAAAAKPPDMNLIEAAFADTPIEDLQGFFQASQTAQEHLDAISKVSTERVGIGAAPDLGALGAAIKEVGKLLQAYLAKRGYGAAPEEAAAAASGASPAQSLSGEITSIRDVQLALDKVCRYYEANEVSSPVPVIIRSAQRLVSKSFLEINKVLSPDAVRLMEQLSGMSEQQST